MTNTNIKQYVEILQNPKAGNTDRALATMAIEQYVDQSLEALTQIVEAENAGDLLTAVDKAKEVMGVE